MDGKLLISIRDISNDCVIENTCFILDFMIKYASGKIVEKYLYRFYYGEENLKLINDEREEENDKLTIDAHLTYNSIYGMTFNKNKFLQTSNAKIYWVYRGKKLSIDESIIGVRSFLEQFTINQHKKSGFLQLECLITNFDGKINNISKQGM